MNGASPLTILYQDEWLIAVDKPAGQLVHPADIPQEDDQVTMKILRDQIGAQVRAIHRLDRPTTGVLLFSTNRTTTRALSRAFERHQVQKVYHAIIDGHPSSVQWRCEEPLRKSEDAPEKEAATDFQILKKFQNKLALVEALPRSGRYHQIRRHLLHGGTPIVGDYRYTGFERCEELAAKHGLGTRMFLQSKSLTFTHPSSKEEMTITAPEDPLFERLALACFD